MSKDLLTRPFETNEDVKAFRAMLAEAAQEMSVEMPNGALLPKGLVGKDYTSYEDAQKNSSTIGDNSVDPNSAQGQATLKAIGADKSKMAHVASGSEADAYLRESDYKIIRITRNPKETKVGAESNYDMPADAKGVIGADGTSQDKMEKGDGSINYQVVNPIIELKDVVDHLAQKYDVPAAEANGNTIRNLEGIISKTTDKGQRFLDMGENVLTNFGVDPNDPTGSLQCFDPGTFRHKDDMMMTKKDGTVKPSKKSKMAEEIMNEAISKVPEGITEGFALKPKENNNLRGHEYVPSVKTAKERIEALNKFDTKTATPDLAALKQMKDGFSK